MPGDLNRLTTNRRYYLDDGSEITHEILYLMEYYRSVKGFTSNPPEGDNYKEVKNVYVEMVDGKPKFWFQYETGEPE